MELRTYLSFFQVMVTSFIIKPFWLPVELDNQ